MDLNIKTPISTAYSPTKLKIVIRLISIIEVDKITWHRSAIKNSMVRIWDEYPNSYCTIQKLGFQTNHLHWAIEVIA